MILQSLSWTGLLSWPASLAQTRVIYEWTRLEQFDQWWHWLLLLAVVLAVVAYVTWWYRRDSIEQPRPVGWALTILRMAAFVGLLLYFLQFDRRTEQRVVRNSRVAVLVDTSLSMTLPGTPSASGISSTISRSTEIAQMFAQSPVLSELSREHEVAVYRFDQSPRPVLVAALNKADAQPQDVAKSSNDSAATVSQARVLLWLSCFLGAVASVLLVISFAGQLAGKRTWAPGAWMLLVGTKLMLISLIVCACGILPASEFSLAEILGVSTEPLGSSSASSPVDPPLPIDRDDSVPAFAPTDWANALAPTGIETRLGEAIKSTLDREQGSPLAAIIIMTDGRNNGGLDPKSTLISVQNSRIPLMIVGVGSPHSPPNVKLVEVDAPKRLYPGDKFSLSALVQSSGFAGKVITLQVSAGPKDTDPAGFSIQDEIQLTLPDDNTLATARFELAPRTVGKWTYLVKAIPLDNDADLRDNEVSAGVEVVERKNRVLIFSGGPNREYQFARNLLYRDRDVESHVFLQTGRDGMSQEAAKLLTDFPADRAALSAYDAILAFDADWTKVPDAQVEAVEQWVAEQAGGLMLIAGTVEMPKWLTRSASGMRTTLLRGLSPVVLEQRGSVLLSGGRAEAESSWPLKLTADGLQSDFLWLNDDPVSSGRLWEAFKGVYSYHAAYELKPGAKALALFSDPTAQLDGQAPIYLANHFYGAGRVLYQGGSEMWRLREVGDQYFDRYYTKLVRWISQGRLLMDSDRGVLLVDREQALLGDQVTVRAVLKDQRFQPLIQSEVVARLLDPQKRSTPLVLRPMSDGSQPGVYTGQFPIQFSGEYSIQLQLGGLTSEEVLTALVKAKVPAMEMQRGERFDELLSHLAVQSGGKYLLGASEAIAPAADGQRSTLVANITAQDQITFLPGAPDRNFQLRWLAWLMAWIAGSLSIEWIARRLHRLA